MVDSLELNWGYSTSRSGQRTVSDGEREKGEWLVQADAEVALHVDDEGRSRRALADF